MADADAGPSKPPVSKTPKATYTYGNKELDAPAYAEALKSAKARGSASWWSFFTVILTERVVKLKCTICGEVLGAKNPSATAPNHLKKHSKAADKAQEGKRNWSLWGNIFTKARNRLGKERAEKLIYIRQNRKALQMERGGKDEEVLMQLLEGLDVQGE
ncbi:hypothetical protein VOLCADRAFT_88786 [Volvox carteri f. nagariensis]|uniref:DUF7963 domain-containing protein n=1 Tax=Volvox carteri f. nagariensis TaxID=3068 RepID=D8TPY2_VOLCA|nr:uncharacterized protein VOLCADRAFT_88786 [Volvox carteri f. nagariensis]XP_002959924.1 uncharacterized protein VOLCADRAFT_101443 [Volvox carteri f. nagariensis]EFJ39011.1 hypothetical protein VOLCADRAFT_101443 [Volvox carteri f. nagariensis]EFJ50439.1 hypothetical protein VOLCADRAFT_88786 [Volvox carteri f. nagariensis]|eukprot:XP_002948564.1 hypothetical protein VOLCADRAFT_88786 [Volvox carteri f. nagariensis]